MKKLFSLLLCILLLAGCAETYDGPVTDEFRCSKMITTYYDADGQSQQYLETYDYDLYGNRSVIRAYTLSPATGEETPTLKTVLRYDENGNVLRQTQYDVSGWLPEKIADARYTYDDRGRITSTRHHAGGLSWDNDTTVYDDEAMTRTVTTGEGAVTIDYLNEQGWVLRTEQTSPDGQTVLTEYDRRPDGQTEATRTYTDGILTGETVMTYDGQGRCLTQTEIKNGTSTLLFAWEYGDNWERMTCADGSASTVTYREDGRMQYQYHTDADGQVTTDSYYYYIEIQVPAEEVSP